MPPTIVGLIAHEACGRIDGVLAILSSPSPLSGDLAWNAQTISAFAGLVAPLGDAERVDRSDEIAAADRRTLAEHAPRDSVLRRLRDFRAEVLPLAVVADHSVALETVADPVGNEVRRAAAHRGGRIAVDLVCPGGSKSPRGRPRC